LLAYSLIARPAMAIELKGSRVAPLLRVLMLVDTVAESDALARELRRAGFELAVRRATTEAAYLAELESPLDLILADNALSEFDAMRALQILRASELDIPLIVVTESAGEATAIECVSLGAADFLFKDRPARLGTAVVHALDQRELRAHARATAAALRASEERFRAIFQSIALGIAIVDLHGHQIMSNPAFQELLGYTDDELRGRSFAEYTQTDDIAGSLRRFNELVAGQRGPYQIEKRYVQRSGRLVWVRLGVALEHHADNAPQFVIVTVEDITARKQAEEALRESEERFRTAYEYAAIGMALVGLDGRWLQANRALCDFIGYTEQELLATTFQAITHPDDLELDLANVRALLAGEILSYQMEKRYFHKHGATIWVLLSVSLVRDAQLQPSYFVSQIQDITERKRDDRVLRQTTAFIQLFQEVAVAANQATSLDQALQTAVNQICTHIGWPVGHVYLPDPDMPGALLPTGIWHLDDAQRFAAFRKITEAVRLAPGIGLPGQVVVSRKPAWIADMILDVSTPRTKVIQDVGVRAGFALPVLVGDEVAAVLEFFATEEIAPDEALLDVLHHVGTQLGRVVERARAEAAVRESEQRFRVLFEHSPDAIILIDPHHPHLSWPIVECNDIACRMNGFTRDELIGQSVDLLNGATGGWAERAEYLERLRREGSIQFETSHRRNDGSLFPIEVVSSLISVDGRELVLGIDRDISERKRAEAARLAVEAKYRTLVEQIPAIIYTAAIDERSSTYYVSPQIETILGFSPEEWLVDPEFWLTQVHPDDRAHVLETVSRSHTSDMPIPVEYRSFTREGHLVWLRDTARVVRDESDQPLFLQGIVLDITERKRTEEALARYQLLSEHARDIILFLRSDGQIIEANQAALVAYGYTRDELLARSIYELRPAGTRGEVDARLAQVDDAGILYETIHCRKDARLFPVEVGSRAAVIGDERVIVSIIRDITQRKQAEQRSVAFAALGRQLASATTAKAAARVIANVADDLAGWDAFVLQLYSAETNIIVRVLSYDIVDGRRTELVSPAPGPPSLMAQRVFTAGAQLLLHDHQSFGNSELVPFGDNERPSASLMFVPIHYGATVIGLLSIQSYTPQAYTAEDLDTLQSLADHCSGALERIRVGESLRESERLYRTLASNFPNGAVVLFDHDLRFTIADGAGLGDIGLSSERLEGHTLWEIYPPEASLVNEPIFRAALAGTPTIREVPVGDLTLVIHTLPVRDEHGQIIAGMLMSQDITERKRMEAALIDERALLARRVDERTADLSAANAELARTAILKDAFLASMSHELRTPLNAVLGLSEALQEEVYGPLNDRQRRSLHSIEESGRHLLDLINDILDLAKIGAGKLELALEPASIEMICQASLRLTKQIAHKQRLSVDLTLDPAVTLLQVDARRVKQILVNLLSNAVKFTPEGGSIGLEVAGDAARQAVDLTVWDTGIGIAQEQMTRLFQPFVQLDSRLARQYEGTGLGLALVYRMVELHGGSISVTSEVGHGSRFTVALPWHTASAAAQASAPAAPDVVAIDRTTIRRALVVEDSPTTADQITRYLHELAIESATVRVGAEVVALAIAEQPDLILLDLLLPDSSGWDVLAQLKAEPRTRAIPVVIMSVIDERSRGLALGAAEYLVKPFARADLQRVLPMLTPAPRGSVIPQALSTTGTPAHAMPPPLVLLAEDNETTITVFSDYLGTCGYQVIIARNGAEAIARAREARPAIVLMDIQMPGMDGLEATRRIRSIDDLVDLPIIALTALAMPGDRERCLAAGANDYLSKPVSLRGLAILIENHLRQHSSQQRNQP
jgi:PAS domain S-box-containing protein